METLRVLITDDEPGMRLGAERALRTFRVRVPDANLEVGFAVEHCETGESALDVIRRDPPDILLLDHKLPGISGLDVLDEIISMQDQMRSDMLTIMITAYATIETAVTATKRGAYDFLAKPFTPEELRNTIRKAAARIILAKQARKLTAEKRQVRFQFIRVLGHELKAPLNAIEGYLRLAEHHTLGSEVAAYDDVVTRSLVRIEGMRKLIADLLDMTRIESGQRDRRLTPLNLRDVAEMAIETVAPQADERGITITLDADPVPTMTADRGEIEIVLNNLLSNAVKYNRDGGSVTVTITRISGLVRIAVADTGIGLTREEADKLFGEFVRIKNTKTRNILGSGLGLSIVKTIAQLYDGHTSVESRPDAGSTFTVILKDPGVPAAVASKETASAAGGMP